MIQQLSSEIRCRLLPSRRLDLQNKIETQNAENLKMMANLENEIRRKGKTRD